MSLSWLIRGVAEIAKTLGARKGARTRARCATLSGVLALALLAGNAGADCPQGDRMSMLIEIQRGSVSMQELWEMGADPFGVDGNNLHLRVCDHMAEQLTGRGVAYEVIHEDIYKAYRQYRPTPPPRGDRSVIRRDESFVDYHDLDAVEAAMQRIADNHPDLAALEVIGQSIEGRSIHALRISNKAATVDHDRPAMVVVGCHHAREWISVEVPLHFADYLAENYLSDGRVTRLLNYAELWIIPVLNPDGYAFTWTDFPDNRFWRKNRRDNGNGDFGVDMNRNYAVGWGGGGSAGVTFSETYRGTEPFSEPETQALRDLMDENAPNGRAFVSLLSYHNYSQVVLYPNGFTTEVVANTAFYERLAGQMTQGINAAHTDAQFDYAYGQTSHLLYVASGGTTDWVHHALGGTGIIIELRPGAGSFEVPPEQILPTCEENLPAFLHMAETTLVPDRRAVDADLDGFVDAEDYCPRSPALTAVDATGCTEAEQDVDGDGVPNPDDACRDSAVGQQVDAEGCRVGTLFTLHLTSNVESVEIDVDPPDIDAAGADETGRSGFSREYAEETTFTLTASEVSYGNRFHQWVIDGEPQSEGELSVTITAAGDVAVEAVYVVPDHIEVVGLRRIPDRRDNGLAYIAPFTAQIVYLDGSTQAATTTIDWTLSDESIGLLTAEGELVVYDVSPETGEVEVIVTAAVELAGVERVATPFKVTIFDAESMAPRCRDIALSGPDRVDSDATHSFDVTVLLDGDQQPRTRPGDVRWTVSRVGADERAALLASVSAAGVLSTQRVSQDVGIVLRAAYVNDDGTVCLAEQEVTISAGEASDEPAGSSLRGTVAPCGVSGMISLFGLFVGLIFLRIARR